MNRGGIYEVKIDKMWKDRETGYRYKGKLISKKDIEFSENVGTTGFKPENYKKYGEKIYADVLKAQQNFCPSEIYFSEFDIIEN